MNQKTQVLLLSELERGDISPYPGAVSPIDTQNLKQLTILELKHATNNFSEINIIGEGSFGLAYKGLLQDGSLVVIKRHLHTQIQNFLHEVKHIARVHHRHLVKLVGFCEENHQQLLIYDYIPNGNVQNHLYGNPFISSSSFLPDLPLSIFLFQGHICFFQIVKVCLLGN